MTDGITAAHTAPRELSREEALKLGLTWQPGMFVATISDDSVDRMGDIVEPGGADVTPYLRNPIVYWNHNRNGAGEKTSEPPIGRAHKVWREGRRWRAVFTFHETTRTAIEIADLWRQGVLRTTSIGFSLDLSGGIEKAIEEIEHPNGLNGYRFKRWVLHEFSVVNIPANANAEADIAPASLSPNPKQDDGRVRFVVSKE